MQLLEVIWRDPCLFYLDYPDTIHSQDVNIDNIQVQIQNTGLSQVTKQRCPSQTKPPVSRACPVIV